MKASFLILLVLMNVLSFSYWNQVQTDNEFEQTLNERLQQKQESQELSSTMETKVKEAAEEAANDNSKVRSGKVVVEDSAGSITASNNDEPLSSRLTSKAKMIDSARSFTFPNSRSRSDELKCNDYSSYSTTFFSQEDAKNVVNRYATDIIAKSQRPRFVPVLQELIKTAKTANDMILTVQLGGMDGLTGDPFYRMTQLYKEPLNHWLPVVIEPVHFNFEKLIKTYQGHQTSHDVKCGHLLQQLINYDPKQESPPGKCGFCHFDEFSKASKCHDIPSWQKYEIGSMECDRKAVQNLGECFVRSEFDCSKIIDGGLSNLGLKASQIAVLQIDVEGFEQQVLEGFFSELDGKNYPPVINFENKVLMTRKQLQPVYDLLKSKGYSLHEKRVDTLCLLGHVGDTDLKK